jgi:elongation factor G
LKTFALDKIRNIVLTGPRGVGKTSLADAILHVTGKVGRRGNIDDGSSVFDYHDEEIERRQTISASLGWTEVGGVKINLIDTPGQDDFRGDVFAALEVCEAALFLVKGDGGLEVPSEALWRVLSAHGVPTLIVLNRMNKEHSHFAEAVRGIQARMGAAAVPVQLPIGEGEAFKGIVDLITQKAHSWSGGKAIVGEPPADMADAVAEAREALLNAAAETDDALVEKFLEQGSLSEAEVVAGLIAGIVAGKVFPILCTAADSEVGVLPLLETVVRLLPAPAVRTALQGHRPGHDDAVTLNISPTGAKVAFAFKRQSEAQGGDITWLRVWSGTIASGDSLTNSGTGAEERIGQLSVALGKQREKIDAASAGDIVIAAKLKSSPLGSTLYDGGTAIALPAIPFPRPTATEAIYTLTAGDEDKMSSGLTRLHEEDPTFTIRHEPHLSQTLLIAQGESQIAFLLERLKKLFGVEVARKRPRVAFRETVRGKAEVQGRHKKQTGGRGQFGDVWLRIEPQPRGAGFEFVNGIVGGVVPGKFVPAVEKGVRETMTQGVVAGYEVVDLRTTIYDGSYHNVDSSEAAFKIAARKAIQKGVREAGPMLLEPVMTVTVTVPEAYMGDVMGDISSRRGRIQGMENDGPYQVVKALIPQDELYQYATALRSMTQGTGVYRMDFSHYDEVPGDVARKLMDVYEKSRTEEED